MKASHILPELAGSGDDYSDASHGQGELEYWNVSYTKLTPETGTFCMALSAFELFCTS